MHEKEKSIRKKLFLRIGLYLAMITLMAFFSVVMASAEDVTYSEGLEFTSNGDGTCSVSGIGTCKDTEIVIPPVSPEGDTVTAIGESAFDNASSWWGEGDPVLEKIISISLPNTVTSIGKDAFMVCKNLKSINIPESVTSIGFRAFEYTGLISVTIPGSVACIENSLFSSCNSLQDVAISEGVTSIGFSAFEDCISLENVQIPKSITNIDPWAFSGCSSLTSIHIPENVKHIYGVAFSYCRNLDNITVDDGNMYYRSEGNCLIDIETKTLLVGCSTSVIPTDGSVTAIGDYAFSKRTKLSEIIIPDCVTSIGESAFSGCSNLTSIAIPSGVKNTGLNVFAGCKNLKKVQLSEGLEIINLGAFYDCTNLTDIRIPSTVRGIAHDAFDGCSSQLFRREGGALYVDNWVSWCAEPIVYLRKDVAGFCIYSFGDSRELYFYGTQKEWNALPGTDGIYGGCTVHYMGDLVDLTGASLTLGDSLTMNYYAKADPAYSNVKMRFTYRGVTFVEKGTLDETSGEYVFSLKGIAPQYMSENIKAELIYVTEDGMEIVVDTKDSYSIRQYCDEALAADPDNQALTTLLADLLAYGDAAQNYVDNNEDTPVSEGFGATPSEWADVTDTDFALSEKTREDIRFTAAGVRFGYVNRIYFKLKTVDPTGVTLTVNGKTFTADDLALVEDTDDTYILYTDGIYATEFDKIFTAELSVDGEVIQTLTYSVKSYVYAKQNTENDKMAALARALYNYGRSAVAYKNAQ